MHVCVLCLQSHDGLVLVVRIKKDKIFGLPGGDSINMHGCICYIFFSRYLKSLPMYLESCRADYQKTVYVFENETLEAACIA